MNTPSTSRTILVFSILAVAATPVFAAPVSWSAPQTVSGDSDVSLLYAFDRAHLFAGGSTVVNGVTFSQFNGSGDTSSMGAQYNAFGGGGAPFDNLSAGYRSLLTNGFYGDNNPQTITLNSLSSGLDYEVQFWVNDSRNCCSGRSESVSGSAALAYSNIPGGTGGVGSYVKGIFTADGASQTLTTQPIGAGSSQVNGIQLRAIGAAAGNTATISNGKNYTALSAGAGGTINFNVTGETWNSTVISGAGGLQKSGAGALTITSAQAYSGATTVSGGTLRLGTPTGPAAGSSLWLDASNASTLTTSGSNVTQWNDAGGGGNFLTVGGGTPVLQTNALNGRSVVDLGAYGSGSWMSFNQDMTNIQSAFFISRAKNFMLGSTYNYHFHRGGDNGANYGDPIWSSAYASPNILNGQTFLNGQQVNGTTTGLADGYSMVDVITSGGGVESNALANDRNIGGRTGGQQIGEIILFNSALSAANRVKTEAYLAAKWFAQGGATNNVLPTNTPVSMSGGGILDLAGFNQTVGSLSGLDASGTQVQLGAGRLTVGGSNNTVFDGTISGTGGITRAGNGALTLSGANTYSGTTNVDSGKLLVNGSLSAASAVTVAGGATFGGAGTVNGATTVNAGGIIESTTGMFSLASLTFSGVGALNIGTAGGGSVNVLGSNALTASGAAGSLTINIIGSAPALGSHTLINYDGTIGGSGVSGFALGTLPNRVLASLVNDSGATQLKLDVTGTDFPVWSGAAGSEWSTASISNPKNWVLNSNSGTGTDYLVGDNVLFNDAAIARTVVINNGNVAPGSVLFNNTTAYTVSGTNGIAGATDIVKNGTGTVTLGGANTFTGAVAINAGTIRVGSANALGSPATGTTVAGSATLDLNGTALGAEPVALNGSLVNNSATAASFSGDIAAGLAATLGGTGESTLSGIISGGGILTKADAGRVILSGSNTFGGQIAVNAGALRVTNSSGLGAGGFNSVSNSFIADGAALELDNNVIVGEHFHFTGHGIGGTGGVRSISGTNSLTTSFAIDANSSIGVDAGTLNVNAVIYHDSGSLSLTKVGAGTLVLNAANTFSGGLNVNAGIVKAALGNSLGAGAVAVNSGGSLDMNAQTLSGKNIAIAGAGADATLGALGNGAAAANLNSVENITLTGDATIGGNGGRWDIGRYDFAGAGNTTQHIFGNGHVLTKVGTSYVGILGSAFPSSDLAGTVVNGGTLAPHESLSFGSGPVTVNTGGIVRPWSGPTFQNNFTLNGGTVENEGFTDTYNGAMTIGAAGGNFTGGGTTVVTGALSGGGVINKFDGSTLRLAGTNTHTGDYNVYAGNLRLANAGGNIVRGNLNLNGGSFTIAEQPNQFGPNTSIVFQATNSHAEVALYGNNQTVAGISSINALAVIQNSHGGIGAASANAVLTINQNYDSSYSGYIRNNTGNDATTLGIVKGGTGKLSLSGPFLQYTGATIVSAGTLEVNGNLTGSTVFVNGGTLSGTGPLGPVVAYTGGKISPGNSPGVMTAGSLAMGAGSILSLEISGITLGTEYDQLSIGGTVDITGATLSLSGSYLTTPAITNDLFTILLNDGAADPITGTFAGLGEGGHVFGLNGQDFTISYIGGDGNDIVLSAVPEPGSATLLLGGLALLAARRRRS